MTIFCKGGLILKETERQDYGKKESVITDGDKKAPMMEYQKITQNVSIAEKL